MERLQPLVGLLLISTIAVAWSTNRRAISLRTVAWGFGLQLLFAIIVLKTGFVQAAFQVLGDRIRQLLDYSTVGAAFVFGPKSPSTGPGLKPAAASRRCRSATKGPLEPWRTVGGSAEAFARLVRDDFAKHERLVRELNIKAN